MALDIFNKRLAIVAGKGGVGKSLVSSALALCAARRGKRVLIVEMSARERAYELFDRNRPSGYRATEIFAGIDSINIRPEPALKEYGLMKLKWQRLYNVVFENEVMRALTRMIPGMNELLLIGKTWHLEQEMDSATGKPRWDFIVLDAPATGHGVSLLSVPQVISNTVKSGPMADEVQAIKGLLTDAEKTCISVVTRPEEMPVNEALEFASKLQSSLGILPGYLFVNGVWPKGLSKEQWELLEAYEKNTVELDPEHVAAIETMRFRTQRSSAQAHYLERLDAECELPQVRIPYQFSHDFGLDVVDVVSRKIDVGVDRHLNQAA